MVPLILAGKKGHDAIAACPLFRVYELHLRVESAHAIILAALTKSITRGKKLQSEARAVQLFAVRVYAHVMQAILTAFFIRTLL
jgi:hypothetical protein